MVHSTAPCITTQLLVKQQNSIVNNMILTATIDAWYTV